MLLRASFYLFKQRKYEGRAKYAPPTASGHFKMPPLMGLIAEKCVYFNCALITGFNYWVFFYFAFDFTPYWDFWSQLQCVHFLFLAIYKDKTKPWLSKNWFLKASPILVCVFAVLLKFLSYIVLKGGKGVALLNWNCNWNLLLKQ